MFGPNNYKYITTATNYSLAGNDISRILIKGIMVNKALTGTLTIKSNGSSGTTIGVLAAATPAGMYWVTTAGILVENPAFTNSSSEDITIIYSNAE